MENYFSENLGLSSNPDSITLQCTNKYEMRKKLKENTEKKLNIKLFRLFGEY